MILSYHHIATTPGHYTVSEADFTAQLHFLKARYEPVSLDAYVQFLLENGHNHPEQAVVTFDDAFVSFSEKVLPVAAALDVPVTLFVPTGFLGRSDEWNPPAVRVPIMSEHLLLDVAQHPLVTIGSHTVSHPSLARLDAGALQRELTDSKQTLERLLQRPVDFLAYPFGQPSIDFNDAVQQAARAAGYRAALSTRFQPGNTAKDLFGLRRITVEPHYGVDGLQQAIRPGSLRSLKQALKDAVNCVRYR